MDDPSIAAQHGELPVACTLGASDGPARLQRWEHLHQIAAPTAQLTNGELEVRYQPGPEVLAELQDLVAEERVCGLCVRMAGVREFDGGRPFPLAVDARTRRQVGAVESIVVDLLGDIFVGTFLHGSAIRGGLRATSDVDLLAVVAGATSAEQRGGLVRRLLPLSGSRAQNGPARPIELTVVDQAQLRWLTFPPRREFRYGEWERTDYENGFVPESTADADLGVLVAAARDLALPLGGPPLSDLSQPVDSELLRRAVLDAVPDLMADLDEDTRNVLLTLARIWCTLDTGMIRSKDAAAAWCRSRLEPPQRPILDRCRELYLAGDDDDWGAQLESARRTATTLEQHIRQSST